MKSNVPEVRALLQALTNKLAQLDSTVQMDSKGIGAALYGMPRVFDNVLLASYVLRFHYFRSFVLLYSTVFVLFVDYIVFCSLIILFMSH